MLKRRAPRDEEESWLKRRDVNVWHQLRGPAMARADGQDRQTRDPLRCRRVRRSARMKNSPGSGSRRPLASLAKYRWGLTGTPASNGLEDLFGQFLILDDGAALGSRIARFRHEYFEKHYDGFTTSRAPAPRRPSRRRSSRTSSAPTGNWICRVRVRQPDGRAGRQGAQDLRHDEEGSDRQCRRDDADRRERRWS